jgi:hypothetical protein
VEKVEVTELKDNTFYALVHVETAEGSKEVDARPSDAIALALKTEAPIFVDESVFTEAGMRGEVAQGESPQPTAEDRLMELNRRLKQAVEEEEYEEAARIRDEIKQYQQAQGEGGEEAPGPGEEN